MLIIVTRSTFIGGALVESNPAPIEVDKAVGLQLIQLGKAVAAPIAPAPVAVETPPIDPAPEAKKEKPKAKGK